MTKWKTIDTAPRDGTKILVLLDGDVFQASWHSGFKCWEFPSANAHGCDCCSVDDDEPTHWMSLPDM